MSTTTITKKQLKKKFIITVIISLVSLSLSLTTFFYGYKLIKKPVLAVLLFHEVIENPKLPWMISPQKIEYYIEKLLALNYKPVDPNNFENMLTNGFEGRNFMITFDDGSGSEYEAIVNLYKKYDIKSVLFLVEDFIPEPENISVEKIRYLQNECKTFIGIHGKQHYSLPILLKKDLDIGKITEESRLRLNLMFNTNIKWIAYPFGEYSEEVINELRTKTSLNLAFTTDSGNIDQNTDRMKINRYMYLSEEDFGDNDDPISLKLLPPEDYEKGKFIISISIMLLIFFIGRIHLAWKYYKAFRIVDIKNE